MEFYTKALPILNEAFGDTHHLYAVCLSNIGEIYAKEGKYKEAVDYLLRSLMIDADKGIYEQDLKDTGALINQCLTEANGSDKKYVADRVEEAKAKYPQFFK